MPIDCQLAGSELYDKEAPGIFFSSVVAQELLAGARTPAGRKRVEILLRPFEKAGRVLTPTHSHWKDAGTMLAKLLSTRPDLKAKLPALLNDCLLALCAVGWHDLIYQESR